ncbi:HAD family hydrolase [Streptomyces sp. NPDC048416]|uniref:HAD family hydrolase n=1 Tax=Streptomyces sp. NPDC048416 TaxID=3365546 RepID=UPI0037204DA1
MPLIVLWDIDHTLIDNAGVSKEIYAAAYAALAGIPPVRPASTGGRTDRLIMRDMFLEHGRPEPEWAAIEEALAWAGEQRLDELRKRGAALPGVREALQTVSVQDGWVSSVLTGNIMPNARVKLSAFDLDPLLDMPVGAYGADAMERPALVDVARQRIRDRRGLSAETPVVLVGDTPRDVEAALMSGAEIIAVATGIHSQAELAAAGAHMILPDLTDASGLLELLKTLAEQRKRPRTSQDGPRMR